MERFPRKQKPGAGGPNAVSSEGSAAFERAGAGSAALQPACGAAAEQSDAFPPPDVEVGSCSSNGGEGEQDLSSCDQETAAWLSGPQATQIDQSQDCETDLICGPLCPSRR